MKNVVTLLIVLLIGIAPLSCMPMSHQKLLLKTIKSGDATNVNGGKWDTLHLVIGVPAETQSKPSGSMVLMFEGDQKSGTHQFAIDLNDSTPCNWLDGQSQKGFILEAKNMKSELLEVFAQSKTVSIRVGEWRGASETTLWLIWID